MTSREREQQVAELVKSALECPREERSEFLDEACAEDRDLRAEVDSFLQFQDDASQFIEQGAVHLAAATLARRLESPSPQQVAGYEIISRIGVGGMGEVYLAHDTKLRRKVALKLVRAGMDTAEIVARFRHEEQIMASLNHPNIAQLYGAGIATGDVPFFAMEFIEGVRIDQYCSAHTLPTPARLELFRKVCAAVHYAHQRLIVHRDLKPSNILVNSDGEPKLLDFGIAKLIEGQDRFTQMQTIAGAMTPDYASPEQVRGEAITTSSDVYSLGVLLYELLTGQRPYRLKTRSPDEIVRAITDQEPERPSTVIARAENSRFEIRDPRFLKSDLDNIVLMALRKEAARRYASVGQFSDDIRRYLEGLPVIAHKDTVPYRAGKFIKRNQIGVVAAGVILLTLLGGVIATAWQAKKALGQARIAAEERDHARKEATKAERINTFLQNILGFSDPTWLSPNPKGNREATIADALDEAGRRAPTELADQPEVLAAVQFTLGWTYKSLGKLDLAEPQLRSSLDLRRRTLGPNHQDIAQSLIGLGEFHAYKGKFSEAEVAYREAVQIYRAQEPGKVDKKWFAISLNNLATAQMALGNLPAAEPLTKEAIEVARGFKGMERAALAVMLANLGFIHREQGDLDGAVTILDQALEEHRKLPGGARFEMGADLLTLASILILKADYDRAETVTREAFEILHDRVGEKHPYTSRALVFLANIYYRRGDYPNARKEVEHALDLQERGLPKDHTDFATSWMVKGKILVRTGESVEGESYLRRALDLRTRALPQGHYAVAEAQGALGECLVEQSRYAEAEALLVESHKVINSKLSPRDPRTKEARGRLITLYETWRMPEKAASYRDSR